MHSNNKVRLIIGKIDTSIPFEVRVKQGDIVAPVLFLLLVMAFVEVIEQEWDKHGIRKIEFKRQITHLNLRENYESPSEKLLAWHPV